MPSACYSRDQLLVRRRDVAAKDKLNKLNRYKVSRRKHANLNVMLPRQLLLSKYI